MKTNKRLNADTISTECQCSLNMIQKKNITYKINLSASKTRFAFHYRNLNLSPISGTYSASLRFIL